MSKWLSNKRILLTVIFVCSLLIILMFFFIRNMFFSSFSYRNAQQVLDEDKENLILVSSFLGNLEYSDIYIPASMQKGYMSVSGDSVLISNPEVVNAIEDLNKKGYKIVGKKVNTIYFQRWSSLSIGKGLAFVETGETPTLPHLTNSVALPTINWYYYEEDFNVWKQNDSISAMLLGIWDVKYVIDRNTDMSYSTAESYDRGIIEPHYLEFCPDEVFSMCINKDLNKIEKKEGTYLLRYDDKLLLQYDDESSATIKYLKGTGEIVYYTCDKNQNPLSVYYTKR